jgi:uncharacterized protein
VTRAHIEVLYTPGMPLASIALAISVLAVASCGRVGFDFLSALDADGGDGDGAPAPDAMLDPDLVAWYPLDGDLAGGAPNVASARHDAACTPVCPLSTTGRIGGAAAFDGSTAALSVADDPELRLADGTVALWMRLARLPAQGQYMVVVGKVFGQGLQNSWEIYLVGGGGQSVNLFAGGDAAGGTQDVSMPWTTPLETWTHLAMTWSAGTVVLYVDGTSRGQSAFSTAYDAGPVFIGADRDGGVVQAHVEGALDDVRIYRRALAANEVAALAAAGGT